MENKQSVREHYISIMRDCLQAWSDADVKRVASFYADDLDYRDPSIPNGIADKNEFIKYLKQIFSIWPSQSWVLDRVYSHENQGAFSVEYQFQIANDKAVIRGCGIDLTIFKGEKIVTNHVYLNPVKWNDWVTHELTRK
jgi:hypothetical protein